MLKYLRMYFRTFESTFVLSKVRKYEGIMHSTERKYVDISCL